VAIAVPAANEAEHVLPCVSALLRQQHTAPGTAISVHVLANNCSDGTADVLRERFGDRPDLRIAEVTLLVGNAHAGWARRLAMDLAADALGDPSDLLLSTDADTIVADDWVRRMLPYFNQGYDAVAGQAILPASSLGGLRPDHRQRLILVRKYQLLLDYLRRRHAAPADAGPDPAPDHSYEGGASIGLTLGMYRAIGGCPPLPVGEDRALFQAVRDGGGAIRHAGDVKVYTSGRLAGRAPGGMADTIRQWCLQPADQAIHELWPIGVALGQIAKTACEPLTFEELPVELARAKSLALGRAVSPAGARGPACTE
jgi:hypothetical protein